MHANLLYVVRMVVNLNEWGLYGVFQVKYTQITITGYLRVHHWLKVAFQQ